jgi:hypothetical protein
MNVALRELITLDDFLKWEKRQEQRYKFDGLQPTAMTGGTLQLAAVNLARLGAKAVSQSHDQVALDR